MPCISLHTIKFGLYMNLRCWRKTLINLLNLTNSVSNFNNIGSETEKSGIKSTYRGGKACWQVIMWSWKPNEARNSRHVDMCTCELTRHVDTWVHQHTRHVWHVRHINTPGMLTREHKSMQRKLAHEKVSMQDMLTCERVDT